MMKKAKIIPIKESAGIPHLEGHDIEKGTPENPVKEETRPFPRFGLTLQGLEHFLEEIGGLATVSDLPTEDVCQQYVKELTKLDGISYCDYLLKKGYGKEFVDVATVFISHAWKYNFGNVIYALRSFNYRKAFNKNSFPIVLWFDLFSNNQHGLDAPPPFKWWCETFTGSIRSMHRVVMILEPWDNPITLTRAWCLWELYSTVLTESRLEVAMSRNERNRFEEMMENDTSAFHDMLAKIDVQNSQAKSADDKEAIFKVVEETVGFGNLNTKVNGKLREWVLSAVWQACEERKAKWIGDVHSSVATTVEKEESRAEQESQQIISSEFESYFNFMLILGELASSQKQGNETFVAPFDGFCKNQAILKKIEEDSYLKAKLNITMGLIEVASASDRFFFGRREQLGETSEINLQKLDEDHMRKVDTLFESGICLIKPLLDQEKEKLAGSNTLSRRKFEQYQVLYLKGLLGQAQWTTHNLTADQTKALQCYQAHQLAYGDNHRNTIQAASVLARKYLDVGYFMESIHLYQECLDKYKHHNQIGQNHPLSIEVLADLADAYYSIDSLPNAEKNIEECIIRAEIKLGADHNWTKKYKNRLETYRYGHCCTVLFLLGRGFDCLPATLWSQMLDPIKRLCEAITPCDIATLVVVFLLIVCMLLFLVLFSFLWLFLMIPYYGLYFMIIVISPIWCRFVCCGWMPLRWRQRIYKLFHLTRYTGARCRPSIVLVCFGLFFSLIAILIVVISCEGFENC